MPDGGRVTQAGDRRVTQAGDVRITERLKSTSMAFSASGALGAFAFRGQTGAAILAAALTASIVARCARAARLNLSGAGTLVVVPRATLRGALALSSTSACQAAAGARRPNGRIGWSAQGAIAVSSVRVPFPGALLVREDGAWRSIRPMVMQGGQWVPAEKAWVKHSGAWRRVV